MKTYVAHRSRGLPLKFTGEIIGFAEDHIFILVLYRTAGGQYVCERITAPNGRSPSQKHHAITCKDREKIRSFFGESKLAATLYTMARIDTLPEVCAYKEIL